MFRLGRKLPIKTFMNIAVVLRDGDHRSRSSATRCTRCRPPIVCRSPPRRTGRGCRSSCPRPPATGRPCRRSPPRSCSQPSTSSGGIYVFVVKPRLAKRAVAPSPDRRRPPLRRRGSGLMAVRVGVDVGGTFTKAVAVDLDRPASSPSRWCRPRTTPRRASPRASCSASPTSPRRSAPTQIELVTHSTTQAVNALLEGDVGMVGVVGLGRRPELAQGAQAHRSWRRSSSSPGKRLRDAAGVPRRHRRPRRGCDRGRARPTCATRACRPSASPRRSRPTTRRTRHAVAAMAADRRPARRARRPSCPGCTGSSCARSPPRSTRRSCRSRCAPPSYVEEGVARRRHRRAGDGDARRRRRDRPRRLPARAGAHALLGAGGIGGRRPALHAVSPTASSSRSVARRRTSPAIKLRAALALVRHGRVATPPRCAPSTCG